MSVRITFKEGSVVEYPEVTYREYKDGVVYLMTKRSGDVVAELQESDIEKTEEVNSNEPTIDHPEAEAASYAESQPDLFGQADGVGEHGQAGHGRDVRVG
jgi:hypothetical protein